MSNNKGKLVKGAAILGIAGVTVKFLGAILRIPLTNWIGNEGMSYYSTAYSIYSVLLIMSTAGLPIALSRLVSERIALGQYKNAQKVFRISVMLMGSMGILMFLICFFAGDFIATKIGNEPAGAALRAISPALLFVPVLAAFRGFFNGRQNMNPTAITEICEQLIRVVVGLTLAYIFSLHGTATATEDLAKAASGATLGASLGSLGAFALMLLIYMLNKRVIDRKCARNLQEVEDTGVLIKKIIWIAVPIIIGSEIMPLMNLVDTSVVVNTLHDSGFTLTEARAKFGLLVGFCTTLVAFPQIFTQAVAVSLVPNLAAAHKLGEKEKLKDNLNISFRLTMIMAFPSAIGIFSLAQPILLLLYSSQRESAIEAVPALKMMALGVILLAFAQTLTGALQAIGKQYIPVANLGIGCVVKLVLTIVLVANPSLNIVGAVIGTNMAYLTASILNFIYVMRYTGVRVDIIATFVKPLLASLVMGGIAWGIHKMLVGILGNSLTTLIAIVFAMAIYGVLLILIKAITPKELEESFVGRKILRFAKPVFELLNRN